MAKIKLNFEATPFTGQLVTFTAPCDCTEVTDGLVINGNAYTVVDALGNAIMGVSAWRGGAKVTVALDIENRRAFLQNGAVTTDSIGAVSKSGDTMTGDLTINKKYPTTKLNDTEKGAQTFFQNANHITWLTSRNVADDTNNSRSLIVGDSNAYADKKNAAKFVDKVNGTLNYYNLYGEHNKPTAADVGAPNLESNGRINGAQACSSMTYVSSASSKTLTADDIGKTIVCYGSTDKTITVPAGLTVGSEFEIVRYGQGAVTIAAASGVTLNSTESARTIKNRYGVVSLKRIFSDTDSWLLVGDLG